MAVIAEAPVRAPIPGGRFDFDNVDMALQQFNGILQQYILQKTLIIPDDLEIDARQEFIAQCRGEINEFRQAFQQVQARNLTPGQRQYLNREVAHELQTIEQWVNVNDPQVPPMAAPPPLAGRVEPVAGLGVDLGAIPPLQALLNAPGAAAPIAGAAGAPEAGAAPNIIGAGAAPGVPDAVPQGARRAPVPPAPGAGAPPAAAAAGRPNPYAAEPRPPARAPLAGRVVVPQGAGCMDAFLSMLMRAWDAVKQFFRIILPCLFTTPAAQQRPAQGGHRLGNGEPADPRPGAGVPAQGAGAPAAGAGAPPAGVPVVGAGAPPAGAGAPAAGADAPPAGAGAGAPPVDLGAGAPAPDDGAAVADGEDADPAAEELDGGDEPAPAGGLPEAIALPEGNSVAGRYVGTTAIGADPRADQMNMHSHKVVTGNMMRRLLLELSEGHALTAESAPAFIDASSKEGIGVAINHVANENPFPDLEGGEQMIVEPAADAEARANYREAIRVLGQRALAAPNQTIGALFIKGDDIFHFIAVDRRGMFYLGDSRGYGAGQPPMIEVFANLHALAARLAERDPFAGGADNSYRIIPQTLMAAIEDDAE